MNGENSLLLSGNGRADATFSLDSKIGSQVCSFVALRRWYKTFSVRRGKLDISKINFEVALCICLHVFMYV